MPETTDDIMALMRSRCPECPNMRRVLEILEGHRRSARNRPSLIAENLALRQALTARQGEKQ